MSDTPDNVPDKSAYQVNRRRMCWVALGMMMAVVFAFLVDPERYSGAEIGPIFYGLSGLVAVYFGATSYQQAKK
jgi:cell division protein FtsW (lipid II flippase)